MNNLALSCAAPDLGLPSSVVSGGYHRAPASQLTTLLASLSSKVITARHLRIYAATLAMVAIREAAKSEAPPRFTPDELLRLLGSKRTPTTRKKLRAALKHLRLVGLVTFTESKIRHATDLEALDPTQIPAYGRLEAIYGDGFFRNHRRMVPVPRRILRAIARGDFTPAMAKMAIVAMLRCLYWHKGTGYRVDGRYKIAEAARVSGVSHSAAQTARRKLIEIGWLIPDDSLRQLQLNRAGVRDSISLDWGAGAKTASRSVEAVPDSGFPPPQLVPDSGFPVRQIPSLVNEHPHTIPQGEDPPEPPVCRVDLQSRNENKEIQNTHTHTLPRGAATKNRRQKPNGPRLSNRTHRHRGTQGRSSKPAETLTVRGIGKAGEARCHRESRPLGA